MVKILDMTRGKPAPLIFKFALPTIIANLFQQIYGVVDSAIVGQWVGANAFSAVGATNALTNTFMAMCWGATIGLGVVVAQYFGAKDYEKTSAAIVNGFYVCIAVAIAITVIALVFTRPFLSLLKTPDALMRDAATYMRVIAGGLFAVTAYHAGFSALRAFGDSKTPLYFMIGANVLNVGLDLLFVIPLGMGVFGAAAATVLSQLAAAVCCIVYAFKTIPYFKNTPRYLKPQKRLISQILKIGLPSGFQYSLIFLSGSVLQRVINGFGESVIGAFTATSRIEILVEQPFAGLGSAIVTYTGQNIGAGKFDRVKQGMNVAVKAAAIYSVVLLAIFWIAGNAVMRIFVDDNSIVATAAAGIRITSIFFIAMGMSRIFRNLLNAAGDSLYSMTNGIVEIFGRIGLAVILTSIPQ
ncbi:MAG: MATE family efflux transporter, partial [Synergistaceae bacterium]|nr:MATE family efflux transporter [Synergistaceae bacterium]